jgi:hypothetical protein
MLESNARCRSRYAMVAIFALTQVWAIVNDFSILNENGSDAKPALAGMINLA